jgi:Mn-dependent DtxR family transcriptional regulator
LRIGPGSEGQEPKAVDEKLLHAIVRLLNNDGYLTAAEIAETLDASLIEVHRTLKNTHGIVMSVPAYFVP